MTFVFPHHSNEAEGRSSLRRRASVRPNAYDRRKTGHGWSRLAQSSLSRLKRHRWIGVPTTTQQEHPIMKWPLPFGTQGKSQLFQPGLLLVNQCMHVSQSNLFDALSILRVCSSTRPPRVNRLARISLQKHSLSLCFLSNQIFPGHLIICSENNIGDFKLLFFGQFSCFTLAVEPYKLILSLTILIHSSSRLNSWLELSPALPLADFIAAEPGLAFTGQWQEFEVSNTISMSYTNSYRGRTLCFFERQRPSISEHWWRFIHSNFLLTHK